MPFRDTLVAVLALVRKDLRLYFSNRRALVMSIVAPIAIAAFFGSLFGGMGSGGLSPLAVAVIDDDASALSRDVVEGLRADPALAVQPLAAASAADAVRRGRISVALRLPAGFGAQAPAALFGGGVKPVLELQVDPSQSTSLAIVRGLVAQHVMEATSRRVFAGEGLGDLRRRAESSTTLDPATRAELGRLFASVDRLQRASAASASSSASASPAARPAASTAAAAAAAASASRPGGLAMPFETRTVEVTAGPSRTYNAYAHSFAGIGMQFILFMGIDLGVGVLLARRLGLWKRLRAAPLSRRALLGAHVLGSAAIALVLLAVIYAAAILGFGVRVDGSWLGFAGVAVAFSLFTAAFGLLIAALGKSPEATRGLAIFVTLVLVMLGGGWIPAFLFPPWLQTATLAIPTRWAIDGLDAMTWRGLGLEAALGPIAVLLAFALAVAAIALWRFDWEEPR